MGFESNLSKPKEKESLAFNQPDVLEVLTQSRKKGLLEYSGSATSDIQAEPLLYDQTGKPKVFSDWEAEIIKSVWGGVLNRILSLLNNKENFLIFAKKKRII